MLEIFNRRAAELSERLAAISERLNEIERTGENITPAGLKSLRDTRGETIGRCSLYDAGPLTTISDAATARDFVERANGDASRLLHGLRRDGETLDDVEAAAPRVSGFYHETRYALALLALSSTDDDSGQPSTC